MGIMTNPYLNVLRAFYFMAIVILFGIDPFIYLAIDYNLKKILSGKAASKRLALQKKKKRMNRINKDL